MNHKLQKILPALFCAILFLTSVVFRPLLPIDETRYLTVAWEMFLQKNYFLPTLNFAPYHHKPPLMFWLINGSWNLFGVSREAALLPFFIAALALMALTSKLAKQLFPERKILPEILPFMIIGSFPFLMYGTIVMFDILLTIFALGTLVTFLSYAEKPDVRKLLVAGLCLGLAGLTKGPVALMHTLLPLALYAFWRGEAHIVSGKRWTWALLTAFVIGLGVVAFWLVNMFSKADAEFMYHLLWKQTAGRVTGDMESSHARPLYFYLPMVPVLFLPWICFPLFWKRAKGVLAEARHKSGVRFLLFWIIPAFVIFSLISGKQPHYLLPLLPPVLILVALCLEEIQKKYVIAVASLCVTVFVGAHIWAAQSVFKNYDLKPIAEYVKSHQDQDWAFIRKYQGEIGFLGRLEKPLASMNLDELKDWFKDHPEGLAVIRHAPEPNAVHFQEIYAMPYRSKSIGIYHDNPRTDGE